MTVDLCHPALSLRVEPDTGLPFDAASLWEGWSAGPGPDPCHLRVCLTDLPPIAPLGAAPIAYGSLQGWATDDQLNLLGPMGGVQVDYGAAAAVLRVSATECDPAFARDTLWRLVTLELARLRSHYYLHGAAWLGPHGADVVCADGGVGKSTLAAAAFAAGHPVITDDAALLSSLPVPQVTALPTAWRVSPPASPWCGLPATEGKQRFWPPVERQAPSSPIGRLLFAERGDSHALVPLSPADALTRLIRQNPLLMTSRRLAEPHLAALRQLADSVPAYRLKLGPQLLSAPETVINLLAM